MIVAIAIGVWVARNLRGWAADISARVIRETVEESDLPQQEKAEVIAEGIPSAASMCYDSKQNQLVIPMNPNNALAFIPLNGRR